MKKLIDLIKSVWTNIVDGGVKGSINSLSSVLAVTLKVVPTVAMLMISSDILLKTNFNVVSSVVKLINQVGVSQQQLGIILIVVIAYTIINKKGT